MSVLPNLIAAQSESRKTILCAVCALLIQFVFVTSSSFAQDFLASTVKIDDSTANGPTVSDDDFYGQSLVSLGDLDGDGVSDIAVGATGDDTGGLNRGAVHISFLNADGSVKSTSKIASGTANGPVIADGDAYGISLASLGDLDGDGVTDIAVGAFFDDTNGSNRGAVHISFLNNDGSVKNTVKIDDNTANGPVLADFDRYGISVASLGDLDGDGVTDIAVGANFDNTNGSLRGAVHISFLNTDGSVKSTTKIASGTPNGPVLADGDTYGSSVASLGDLDGDGVIDIAVGATGDDTGGSNRGAVHISFLNADGSVQSTSKIASGTPNGSALADGDTYGSSVASLGDLDGDGVSDIAVGAIGDDTGGLNRGAIHISFLNTDGSVKNTTKLASGSTNGPVLADNDFYGASVASLGDLSGDGVTDIAVGAYFDNTGGTARGAVHIHFRPLVASTAKIDDSTANGPTLVNGDFYGSSVASLGDLDGDGVNDIAVGAFQDDTGGSGRGAVHISFLNGDRSVKSTAKIDDSTANGPTLVNFDLYGVSVASLGDLDGDGVTDIAVGAMLDSISGSSRGAVHISFLNDDGSIKSTVKIDDSSANGPTLADDNRYGVSVTSLGDLDGDGVTDIAVGAYLDDTGGNNRGAVHISFLNDDGSVKSTVKIDDSTANGPTLADGDRYGYAVTSLGDLDGDGVTDIAVGAYEDDTGGNNRGAVHISFLNDDGSVKSTVKIDDSTANGPTLADFDTYGSSVTSLGDLDGDGVTDIAVGAFNDATGGSSRGAVHISFLNADGSVKSTVKIASGTTNGPTLAGPDNYGSSVVSLGDLDGDGLADIAVGALGDDTNGTDRGAVYLHELNLGSHEISISGNDVVVADGDTSPNTTDNTDFDLVNVGATTSKTFVIANAGSGALTLSGTPRVSISGTHAADFSVTTQPAGSVAAFGGTSAFVVQFAPSDAGVRSATVSIANSDNDENPYDFSIQGTGQAVSEIDISGNSVSIADGDSAPSVSDDTDFGSVNLSSTNDNTFTITNSGGAPLVLSGAPRVSISGSSVFTVTAQPTSPVAASGGTTTFTVSFAPIAVGLATATVSIANDDSDENPFTFSIQGTGTDPVDSDGDGIPDSIDPDDDNDGVSDAQEMADGTNPLDPGSAVPTLPTTFCAEWNSFLGMLNVNEYANSANANRSLDVMLYDLNGTALSMTGTSVLSNSQRDVLVHDLVGFTPNSYGRTCTTVTNGNPGDVDGRTIFYHPDGAGFDFAISFPYFGGKIGSQFVPFNTYHPSLFTSNFVANWVSVINDSTTSGAGTIFYYAQDGSTLGSESATLAAGERRDFAAHQFGANRVGLAEWRPDNQTTKWVVRNVRYYYDNPTGAPSFNSAMQIEGAKAAGEEILVLLDKRNGTAVLELSNATSAAIAVAATFRNSNGTVATATTYNLPARSTIHVVADNILATDVGSVTLDGSAVGSVVAVGVHYGRNAAAELVNAYSLFSREALGSVLRSSYNTFLGQSCDLILVNATSSAVTSSITMTRFNGTVVANGVMVSTPANGVTNYNLCANDTADNYGSVVVQPAVPNSITGAVVRRGAADRYQFATELRQ